MEKTINVKKCKDIYAGLRKRYKESGASNFMTWVNAAAQELLDITWGLYDNSEITSAERFYILGRLCEAALNDAAEEE